MAPPAASRHGAIVRYTVSYQALSGEDTERQEVADIGADASSYVLDGLEKWTEYQVWVRAHTDVGPGPESAPVKMRTKEDGRFLPRPTRGAAFTLSPLRLSCLCWSGGCWASVSPLCLNGRHPCFVFLFPPSWLVRTDDRLSLRDSNNTLTSRCD